MTKSSIPTLEKILGKNYKWWYLCLFGVRSNTTYVVSDILWFIGQIVYIFGFIYLYTKISTVEILHEIIITNLIASFLTFHITYYVDESIFHGHISSTLLQPSNIMLRYFFGTIGVAIRGIVFNIILFIGVLYYFGFNLNILSFIYILPLVLMVGVAIKFFVEFIIGSITFWTKVGYGQINLYLSTYVVLNGSVISYTFLPDYFKLNPFAFGTYHPMQIYLGKYTILQTLYVFLGGLAWCLVLYLLSKLIFKLGLKRYESVGL